MTSEPFVNFHQSERMYHILRSVEFQNRFRVDCALGTLSFGVKNRSLNSSRRLKRLLPSSLANGIRRVACIPDGSFS